MEISPVRFSTPMWISDDALPRAITLGIAG
jgi:hypothetical protein